MKASTPHRNAKGQFIKRPPRASVPAVVPQPLQPLQPLAPPTLRSSWKAHVVIICIAVAWVYAEPFVILFGILAAPFVLIKLLERTGHYRAARVVSMLTVAAFSGFLSGLFGNRYGGGYYGRWRRW